MRELDHYEIRDDQGMTYKQTCCIEYRNFWKRLRTSR